MAGGRPAGYLHSAAKELNSGQPRTNPVGTTRLQVPCPNHMAVLPSSLLLHTPCCLWVQETEPEQNLNLNQTKPKPEPVQLVHCHQETSPTHILAFPVILTDVIAGLPT